MLHYAHSRVYRLHKQLSNQANQYGDWKMTRIETQSPSGQAFYIEESKDFDNEGNMIVGRGFFAGIIQGDCDLSGVFFETIEEAKKAIGEYS